MKTSLRRAIAACLLATACIAPLAAFAESTPAPASGASLTDPVLAQAWERYHAALEESRHTIENSPQYRDVPEQRAKAYHTLMEMQAMAYNFAVAPRLAEPRLFRNTGWQTEIYTLGGNGPDFDYLQLYLDGSQTYRLYGNMRDSRMVLAQVADALPGSTKNKTYRNYDFSKFRINADGSFEVILSATPHEGNWIQLYGDSGYNWIEFRPTVDSPDSQPADIRIERTSALPADHYAADEFDPAAMARRIDLATGWVRYMTEEWNVLFYQRTLANAGGPNTFNHLGKKIAGEVGSASADYKMGAFDLADDEALMIEMDEEPTGAYWSFQLFNVWLRSLDFRTRQSTLNEQQIVRDSDGKYRIVIANRDPGVANWLDTTGYHKGMMLLRNYLSTKPAEIKTTKVKLARLDKLLPKDTARVSPEERALKLQLRAEGYRRRQGE